MKINYVIILVKTMEQPKKNRELIFEIKKMTKKHKTIKFGGELSRDQIVCMFILNLIPTYSQQEIKNLSKIFSFHRPNNEIKRSANYFRKLTCQFKTKFANIYEEIILMSKKKLVLNDFEIKNIKNTVFQYLACDEIFCEFFRFSKLKNLDKLQFNIKIDSCCLLFEKKTCVDLVIHISTKDYLRLQHVGSRENYDDAILNDVTTMKFFEKTRKNEELEYFRLCNELNK